MSQKKKYSKYKKCHKCKQYKLRRFYCLDSNAPDLKFRWCKPCAYKHKILYRKKNPHMRAIEYKRHKKKMNLNRKIWGQKNKEYLKNYHRYRYKNMPIVRLKTIMRNRFLEVIKKNKWSKKSKVLDAIGCTIQCLKTYLKRKFKKGMTWKNHGKWHIDHIIPLKSAKSEQEVFKLFHYTNLQPLWASENFKKGAKNGET